MVRPLWELCSANCPPERPCTPELSDQYRDLWDRFALGQAPVPVQADGKARLKTCRHRPPRTGAMKGPDGKALLREY